MLSTQLKQRLKIGTLSFLIIFISIFFSNTAFFKPLFVLLNAALICYALIEYFHLARQKGFQPFFVPSLCCSVIYVISLAMSVHQPYLEVLPSFVLLGTLIFLFLIALYQQNAPLGNLAITIFGIIYLTIPLSYALRINYFFPPDAVEDGRIWLAYVLAVSKVTDVGAYFIGKWKGKHKLVPTISPKKTVEGAVAGIASALCVSFLFALFSPSTPDSALFKMTLWQSIWIGLLISLLAQAGDLAESLLKRDAGVKNSSHLPGLGGILDTVDSLVFTLPFMYLLLQLALFT